MTASALAGAISGVVDRVQELDARFVAPALALQLAMLGLRAFAWRNVLAAAYGRPLPTSSIACAYATGVALNGFLPARGGEAAKVALVRARIPGTSVATTAGSLSVLCVVDVLVAGALIGTLWATGALPSLPLLPLPDSRVPAMVFLGLVAMSALLLALARTRCMLRVRSLLASVGAGIRIVRSPARFFSTVLPFVLAAWLCRVGAVYLGLQAFRIDAGIEGAVLVAVLSGASAVVPVPGGGGSQQALATYALHDSVSTAAAMSFSFGMQLGVTALNTVAGIAAAMVMFRTLRPLAALRAARG